ncbi:APC family permease [bacterium]|nr:APC family permease [bacterium]
MEQDSEKISLVTAVLMGINVMVGVGILIAPSVMAGIAGNASFLAWGAVALILLPLLLGVVKLSQLITKPGGLYVYCSEGLGRFAGFLGGYFSIVGYLAAQAAVFVAFYNAIAQMIPGNALIIYPAVFFAIVAFNSYFINMMRVKTIGNILNPVTTIKLLPLLILIALFPFALKSNFSITSSELMAIPQALSLGIFSFFGFEATCNISHMIVDSKKNAPRAILMAFFGTVTLYSLFHFGLLHVMGLDNLVIFKASNFSQFLPLSASLSAIATKVISLAVVFTFIGTTVALIFISTSLMFTMADDRVVKYSDFFSKQSRLGRPGNIVMLFSVVPFALVMLLPDVQVLANIANIGLLGVILTAMTSLFIIQSKRRASSYSMLLPIIAVIVSICMMAYSFWHLGDTWTARLIGIMPFAILTVIGLFLYRPHTDVEKLEY